MRNSNRSKFSRRIGSKRPVHGAVGKVGAKWSVTPVLLGILSGLIAIPAIKALVLGQMFATVGGCAAFIFMLTAFQFMRRGLKSEREFNAKKIATAPPPFKLAAHIAVAASIVILAGSMTDTGLVMAAIYGLLGGVGSMLAYGSDPRRDKKVDPALAARAGIDTAAVVEALNEAQGKLHDIRTHALDINCREMVDRLERIVASGERILAQIETDPSDIRRARRFLVTYLDGTRDVVSRYRQQQDDLVDTPLDASFRQVLETVERVFAEQEIVLKSNETLDLEVQIEVLRTQMEKEGVV